MNHSVESSMEHAQNALELRDVTKRFQKKRGEYTYALKGVSLTLKRGEVVGILGPNGSGKSTLVRVISTLTVPDTGTVSRSSMSTRSRIRRSCSGTSTG